jgi:chromosome partitioning protein
LVDLPVDSDPFNHERRLAHALAALPLSDPPIGYILIDTPPALSVLTRAALVASKSLLIPLQLDVFSLEGLEEMLDFLDQVESLHKRRPIQVLGGVATMVDQRFLLGMSFFKRFPKIALSHRRLHDGSINSETFWIGMLRQRVDFKKAIAEQQTIIRYAPHSDAAKDVSALAKEVTSRVSAQLIHIGALNPN